MDGMQGRVQVVMNPSKYEIPSGSTYGYFIADDTDQVRAAVQQLSREHCSSLICTTEVAYQ